MTVATMKIETPTQKERMKVLDHRHIGKNVLVHDRLESTNSAALALAADRNNAGMVLLAHEQTAGRGQYGRTWSAPPGSSVLMSVLLFPPPELRRPVVLTAWAAVSVCETVQEIVGRPAKIKWPNDVLCRNRKVCGILIEQHAGAGTELASVIGIGLNVNQPAEWFAQAGLHEATSLACLTGREHDVATVARVLIQRLDDEYGRLCDGDFAALESCWKWHLGLLGKRVVAQTHAGHVHEGRLYEVSFAGVELVAKTGERLHLAPESIKQLAAHSEPASGEGEEKTATISVAPGG